jgi:copper(I)-binding protein
MRPVALLKTLILQTGLVLGLAMPAVADTGLTITDPYARILMGSGVVYFRVENTGDQGDTLLSASTKVGMTMLMTSSTDANGMMGMDMAPDGFDIAAGAERVLMSGGDHVMLMEVTDAPEAGETVLVELTFREAGAVTLTVPVDNLRRTPPGAGPTAFDVTVANAN